MLQIAPDKSIKSVSKNGTGKKIGVGESTGNAKSKVVRTLLGMYQLDPNWSLSSRLQNNPLVWMLSVNGLMVDVRSMSREVQEMAFEKDISLIYQMIENKYLIARNLTTN